jgi:hypothetical protein
MANVAAVMAALRAQIDDKTAYAAAIERAVAKRKAKEAEG